MCYPKISLNIFNKKMLGTLKFINQYNEIGIIIQMHTPNEFRTDMFGNTHKDEVKPATYEDILTFRPNIKKETFN